MTWLGYFIALFLPLSCFFLSSLPLPHSLPLLPLPPPSDISHLPENPSFRSVQLNGFFFFIILPELYQPSPQLILERFHFPHRNPVPISGDSPTPSSPQPWTTINPLLSLKTCLWWACHLRGIIQYVICCVWLLPFSIMASSLIHTVECQPSFCG